MSSFELVAVISQKSLTGAYTLPLPFGPMREKQRSKRAAIRETVFSVSTYIAALRIRELFRNPDVMRFSMAMMTTESGRSMSSSYSFKAPEASSRVQLMGNRTQSMKKNYDRIPSGKHKALSARGYQHNSATGRRA